MECEKAAIIIGLNSHSGGRANNRERRLRLAGHCVRHSELEVSNLVLWEPTQGKFNRGSQRLTYVNRLRKDTGLQTTAELKTLRASASGVPLPEETRPDDDDDE